MTKHSKTSVTMGKGRKFGSSHRNHLLGAYGYGQAQATGADLLDLMEEDVWPNVEPENTVERTKCAQQSEILRDPTIPQGQWVDRKSRQLGGLSLAFEDTSKTSPRIIHKFHPQDKATIPSRHATASAPMNVPNWPKILRVDSTESFPDGYESIDDELDRVPPHEYLAREYENSRKSAATSVLEGVGRTLKGRDMSRVRDAVWSQTGFFG
ncbi:protein S40-6-like [Tasmannia lanceolata]|uniref:protein S40-6-like n=1 Tax=Tasmannia lanceolata TaxID=3420 RepID=UPI004062B846